jgi:hypothetical protein
MNERVKYTSDSGNFIQTSGTLRLLEIPSVNHFTNPFIERNVEK